MEVMTKTKPSTTTTDQSDEKLVEIREERAERSLEKEEEDHQIINGNCGNNLGNISELCFMDDMENEKSKVDKMRALLKTQLPDSFEEVDDDFVLRRFLRARDHNVEKASNMFLKYHKWRRTFLPKGSISESQVPNEIAQNKFFMQGHDKKGRPIAVLVASRHKKGQLDEFKRYVVYCLDKVCARMPRGHEKFVAIGDLQGWGYSNSDIRGYLASLSLLQDCYPERIEKVFIIHAPYIFMAVWKIVYPFIDNKTKNKFMFVENENLKSTLLSEIDESQLPVEYGGKLPLVPIQDC